MKIKMLFSLPMALLINLDSAVDFQCPEHATRRVGELGIRRITRQMCRWYWGFRRNHMSQLSKQGNQSNVNL